LDAHHGHLSHARTKPQHSQFCQLFQQMHHHFGCRRCVVASAAAKDGRWSGGGAVSCGARAVAQRACGQIFCLLPLTFFAALRLNQYAGLIIGNMIESDHIEIFLMNSNLCCM
jgi:hypothetical protein